MLVSIMIARQMTKSHGINFFNTENIQHNEIRCFFCSLSYLQNQSSVSKINRRTVKFMFESIWICYSSHCVSSLPLSKIPVVDWFTGNA